MILEGPIGVMPNAAAASKEKAFIFVESGQTAAIAAGLLCAWDTFDNSAVAGILQNTYGLRIVVCPAGTALFHMAGFANKAIPAFTAAASARASTVTLQTKGHRSDLAVDTAAADNDTIIGGLLIPSTDTAGNVQGCSNNAAPSGAEVAQSVGIALAVVAVASTATIDGIVGGHLW